MKSKTKMTLLIIGLIIVLSLTFIFSSEWNRAALGSQGYIDEGSKFGIEVKSSLEDAHKILESKGLYSYDLSENRKLSPSGLQNCHGREYPDDILLEAFSDDSWRRGIICIASSEGEVISLSWHYGMFQP